MRYLLLLLVAAAALALSACEPSADVRFRVAVKVNDRGVPKDFSRVWQLRLRDPNIALVTPYSGKFVAEAVPIAIPGRPTLYALTVNADRSGSLARWPEIVFGSLVPRSISPSDRIAIIRSISRMRGQSQALACNNAMCPKFAYFDDEADPTTIHIVDPTNLPKLYDGIEIDHIMITIVSDRPTISGTMPPAFQDKANLSRWNRQLKHSDPRNLRQEAFQSGI